MNTNQIPQLYRVSYISYLGENPTTDSKVFTDLDAAKHYLRILSEKRYSFIGRIYPYSTSSNYLGYLSFDRIPVFELLQNVSLMNV